MMAAMERNGTAREVSEAWDDGTGLFTGLLGKPRSARVDEPEGDFANLLAKPMVVRVEVPEGEPMPQPVAVAVAKVEAVAMAKPGRAVRVRGSASIASAAGGHDAFDAVLAEAMAGRKGYCRVCGVQRPGCMIGPFYGE